MTIGGIILILVIVTLIVPELIFGALLFVGLVGYGILEFILRLFGKSFDSVEPSESEIKDAFINYAESHNTPPEDPEGKSGLLAPQLWSVKPMMHNYESFADECRKNKDFFNKYKK